MEEWKEYKIKDITSILGDGLHGTPKYDENGDVFFINGNNLEDGDIIIKKDTKRVSIDEAQKYIKPLNDRTILVSINGTIGNVAKYNGESCILGKSACYFNVNPDVDIDFVYYVVANSVFKNTITQLATGTTIKNVSLETMRNYSFRMPEIISQRKISSILRSIDSKIKLNKRINDNLEQQAQALFKSWFVDFEPFKDGKFVDSELGMIPEGWKVKSLKEFIYISKSTINPQKNLDKVFIHYSLPACDNGLQPETQLGSEIKSNKIILEDDTILFSKLNPRIKRIWFTSLVKQNSICSTEFIPFKAINNRQYSFVYSVINSDLFYNYILGFVNGATGSHQRFHAEDSLELNIPFNNAIIDEFCKYMEPILEKTTTVRHEISRLIESRDLLLPKLMSGELKINEINN